MMKKRKAAIVIAGAVILFILVFPVLWRKALVHLWFSLDCPMEDFFTSSPVAQYLNMGVSVINPPETIQGTHFNPANSEQFQASVQMTVADGKLYFYTFEDSGTFLWDTKDFAGYLSVFENGTVRRIKRWTQLEFFVFHNGYIYYEHVALDQNDPYVIRCCDVRNGVTRTVTEVDWDMGSGKKRDDFYITKDMVLHIPTDSSQSMYIPISGMTAAPAVDRQETYSYGTINYVVSEDQYGNVQVRAYENSELIADYESSIADGAVRVMPCELGLVIHNEARGNLLYFIHGETAEIQELFTVECEFSVSAANVHGNRVYLSFKRYEQYDVLNCQRYKNDELEGTWCFDLARNTSQKISEDIFDGLFIFDDSGIFACNEEGNIYKLDFEGNIISKILEY